MKGDKGTCIAIDGIEVRRTKFDTIENCEAAYNAHKTLGIVSEDLNTIYRCKVCGMFHFGKKEWAIKFGK